MIKYQQGMGNNSIDEVLIRTDGEPQYSSMPPSPLLSEQLDRAGIKAITRFTNYNEVINFAVTPDFETLRGSPFLANGLPVDVLQRLHFTLNLYWQNPPKYEHPYDKHGDDALMACLLLAQGIQLEDENIWGAMVKQSDGSRYDHTANLAIYGKEIQFVKPYPCCYLEAARFRTANRLPHQTFFETLNLRDLLLTCAYLSIPASEIFAPEKKGGKFPKSLTDENGNHFSLSYDLPLLVRMRIAKNGGRKKLGMNEVATVYEEIIELIMQSDANGSDLTYDGSVFEEAKTLLNALGIDHNSDPFKYAVVVRRPISIWSSVYRLMKKSLYVDKEKLQTHTRELKSSPRFTNHLVTAYMETSVFYFQGDEWRGQALDEHVVNKLIGKDKGFGKVAVHFGGRNIA